MRLIDADALMENYNLKDATKYGNRDEEQREHSYSTLMLYEIADMIEDVPTIEAVPVVHGEWVPQNEGLTKFMCSICKGKNYGGHEKFCPNCGADMRKKV